MFLYFVSTIFVFIFGLCIGSFLNCAIYRLEQEKTLNGRSFCPRCKHLLGWPDLFPLFSFVFLKGRCRYCKNKISWQYPIVELATGLVFLVIFLTMPAFTITGLLAILFLFYFSAVLVFLFIFDLKHYLLPDKILLPAIVIAVIYNIFFPAAPHFVWATIIAAGFFLLIFLVSRGKWMGFGDVKLAVLMGLLLGLPKVLSALLLAFFVGAVWGLILMVFKKKGLKSEIPFGPFLIFGTFVSLFWGAYIIQWYLNLLQI